MAKKTVVLGLFPDRIDILSCAGGKVVASRRIEAALGSDADCWKDEIERATEALRKAVQDMNLDGAVASVLYRSPTSCADFASVPIRSASQAAEAAILGSAEALKCSIDEAACAAMVIGRDSSAAAEPQTHVVVAADHDQAVQAMVDMVQGAGLKFASATPIDALIMANMGSFALQHSATHSGYLHIGEHRSFFVLADRGSLLFARPINLGLEALSNSLTRPVRTASGAEPVELNLTTAREILHTHGFPRRDLTLPSCGLTGAQIIPLLQPILQRFVVELRQSLRFGVADEHRQHVTISLRGPGVAVPNFATLLGGELGLKLDTDKTHAQFDYRAPDSCGSELMEAMENRGMVARLALEPRQVAGERQVGRIRRCLWAGAAVALGLVAFDMVQMDQRLNSKRAEAAVLQSQSSGLTELQSTAEKIFAAVAAMDRLEALIQKEVGESVNIRAAMQELSRVTPSVSDPRGPVQLTSIAFTLDKVRNAVRMNGFAFERQSDRAGASGGRTQLEPFIHRLKSSPLFDEVVLSNVQISNYGGMPGQQFEVNFASVGVPSPCVHGESQSPAPASFVTGDGHMQGGFKP